jgi:magnesium-transporting ATPase (P-type)
MLTGDKGGTAQNIGISCGLIDPEKDQILKLQGVSKKDI